MPLQTLIKQSMKTVTLIISSLFLFMALGVSAQQHGPQHRGQRGHMNPEEMVKKQVEQMKKLEVKQLPKDFDYNEIEGLRLEAREKLNKIKPLNIGQASRISGVSPADISVLLIWLAQNNRRQ